MVVAVVVSLEKVAADMAELVMVVAVVVSLEKVVADMAELVMVVLVMALSARPMSNGI